jgi:hypothetical protein
VYYAKPGVNVGFRRGYRYDTDDDYNPIDVFYDYRFSKDFWMPTVPEKETDGFM